VVEQLDLGRSVSAMEESGGCGNSYRIEGDVRQRRMRAIYGGRRGMKRW
jgi:hypothetical protein